MHSTRKLIGPFRLALFPSLPRRLNPDRLPQAVASEPRFHGVQKQTVNLGILVERNRAGESGFSAGGRPRPASLKEGRLSARNPRTVQAGEPMTVKEMGASARKLT